MQRRSDAHGILKQATANTSDVTTTKWQPARPDVEEWTVKDAVADLDRLAESLHGGRRVLTSKDVQRHLRGTKYEGFMAWITHQGVWPRWASKRGSMVASSAGRMSQDSAIDVSNLREILVEYFREIAENPVESDDEPPLVALAGNPASSNVMKEITGHVKQVGLADSFSKLELRVYLSDSKYDAFVAWATKEENWLKFSKDGSMEMYELRRALQVFVSKGQPGASPSNWLGKRGEQTEGTTQSAAASAMPFDFSDDTVRRIMRLCESRLVDGQIGKLDFKTCLSGSKYYSFMLWITDKPQWGRFSKDSALSEDAVRAGLREFLEVDGPRARSGHGGVKAARSLMKGPKERVWVDDSRLQWSEEAVKEMFVLERDNHDGRMSAHELLTSLSGTVYERFANWLTDPDNERWKKYAQKGAIDYLAVRQCFADYLGVAAPPPPPPEEWPQPGDKRGKASGAGGAPMSVFEETMVEVFELLGGTEKSLITQMDLRKKLRGSKFERYSTWLTDHRNWNKFTDRKGVVDLESMSEHLAEHIGAQFRVGSPAKVFVAGPQPFSEDLKPGAQVGITFSDQVVKEVLNQANRFGDRGKYSKSGLQTALKSTKYESFMIWLTAREWKRYALQGVCDEARVRAALEDYFPVPQPAQEEDKKLPLDLQPLAFNDETVQDIMRRAKATLHRGKLSSKILQTHLGKSRYDGFVFWLTDPDEWPRFANNNTVDVNAIRAALREYLEVDAMLEDEDRDEWGNAASPERRKRMKEIQKKRAKTAPENKPMSKLLDPKIAQPVEEDETIPVVFSEETVRDVMRRADQVGRDGIVDRNELETNLGGTRFDPFMRWLVDTRQWEIFSKNDLADINCVRAALREFLGDETLQPSMEQKRSSRLIDEKSAVVLWTEEAVKDIVHRADQISHTGKLTKFSLQTFLVETRYEAFMRWVTDSRRWARFSFKATLDVNGVRQALREFLEVDGPRKRDSEAQLSQSPARRSGKQATGNVNIVFSEGTVKDVMRRADTSRNGSLSKSEMQTNLTGTIYEAFSLWLTGHDWKRFSSKGAVDINAVRSALHEYLGAEDTHDDATENVKRVPADLVFSDEVVQDILYLAEKSDDDGNGILDVYELQTHFQGTVYEDFAWWLTNKKHFKRWQRAANTGVPGTINAQTLCRALLEYLEGGDQDLIVPLSSSSPSRQKQRSHIVVDYLNNKGQVVTDKFQIDTSSTIWDVKKLIYKKKGVDYRRLLLTGCGELLEDSTSVSDPRVQGRSLELTNCASLGGSLHQVHKIGKPENRGITLKQLSEFFIFIKQQRTKGKTHADDVFKDILKRADYEDCRDKIRVSEFKEFFTGSVYEPFFAWLMEKPQMLKWQSKGHDSAGRIERHQLKAMLLEYLNPSKGKNPSIDTAPEQTLFAWHDLDEQSETYRLPLQYNTFTMRQAIQWIVRPLTQIDRCSYVEVVSSKDDKKDECLPEWFICSSWREPLIHFSKSVATHAKTRNLGQSTSLWICSFALRSEDLLPAVLPAEEQGLPPMLVHLVLECCQGFLLVLDSQCKTFKRIWCCMECLVANQERALLFDIVTCDSDEGSCHVLTDGLTENEQYAEDTGQSGVGYGLKIAREIAFPMSTLLQATQDINVEEALATAENERTYILRYLLQAPSGSEPLNAKNATRRLRGMFATISWQHAVLTRHDPGVFKTLAKVLKEDKTRHIFDCSFSGLPSFGSADITKLMEALPPKVVQLEIDCMKCAEVDGTFVKSMFHALPEKLKELVVNVGYSEIGDDALQYIAGILPKGLQKLRLEMAFCLKLTDSAVADLIKNLPRKLVELELVFFGSKNVSATEIQVEHLPASLMAFHLDLDYTDAEDAANELVKKFIHTKRGLPRLKLDTPSASKRPVRRHGTLKHVRKPAGKAAPQRSPRADKKMAELELGQDYAASNAAVQTNSESISSATAAGPGSVDDRIAEFLFWVADKWKMMYDLFNVYDQQQGRFLKSRSVGAKQFVDFVSWRGFDGNALHVFMMIQQEVDGVARARQSRSEAPDRYGLISMPQLLRFAKRFSDPSLIGMDSPLVRFSRALKQLRGSMLRAWRLDLDVRKTGIVAFGDFVALCRRLGFTAEARILWSSFRPNMQGKAAAPLEFREFDSEEAENLEKFIEALWNSCQFNLDQAWMCLDPCCRGVVTPEEFDRGAQILGFEGDGQLLYKGLDRSGLGKLVRLDMDYLQVFVQNSARTKYSFPPVRALSKWVQTRFGSPKMLLAKLGLEKEGSNTSLSQYDLSQQLVVLGFRGDARRFASFAAELGGGGRVNGAMLYALLADLGGQCSKQSRDWPKLAKPLMKKAASPMTQRNWSDSIEDFSKYNLERVQGHRSYFSIPKGGPAVILLEENLIKREAFLTAKFEGANVEREVSEVDEEPVEEDQHYLDANTSDSQPLTPPNTTPVETVAKLTADALALHNMLNAASPSPSARSVNMDNLEGVDQSDNLVNSAPLVNTPPLAMFNPPPRQEAAAGPEAAPNVVSARPDK